MNAFRNCSLMLLSGALALAFVSAPDDADAKRKRKSVKRKAAVHRVVQERYAAIVVDAQTGLVLAATNAEADRFPASLTKLMTLYMVFEALETKQLALTDKITMSDAAARQPPTKLGLMPGEQLTVDQAIRALVAKSANDVAYAVAERLGGTESNFAVKMTRKAATIGMERTRYVNASGLPDSRQLTTAEDLARLSRALMTDFPQYYWYFSISDVSWDGIVHPNHNKLIGRIAGVDGLKTGFTNSSGFNLSASAVRDGKRVIAVVMGGRSGATRDAHMVDLIESAFAELNRRDVAKVTLANATAPRLGGPLTSVPTVANLIAKGSVTPTPNAILTAYPASPADVAEADELMDDEEETIEGGTSSSYATTDDGEGSNPSNLANKVAGPSFDPMGALNRRDQFAQ